MESIVSSQETHYNKASFQTQVESVKRQIKELAMSQTSKHSQTNSPNYGQSWDTRAVMSEKNNLNLNSSAVIHNSEESSIFSNAPEESKTQNALTKSCVANREDRATFTNNNGKHMSYFYPDTNTDIEDCGNSSRREAMQSNMPSRLDKETHKTPVARQFSISANDISLDDSAARYGYHKEVHSREAQKDWREEQVSNFGHGYHIGVHQQQKQKPLCSQMPSQSTQNGQIFECSPPLGGILMTNTSNTSRSFPGEPSSRSNDMQVSSGHLNSGRQSAKKNLKVCSFDESVDIETNTDKEVTNKCKDVNSFDKLRIRNWGLASLTRQETHVNVLTAVVIALIVMVARLHLRVQAIEDNGRFPSKDRCHCQKDGQVFNKNQAANLGNTVNEDMYAKILQYLGKDGEDTASKENSEMSLDSSSVSYSEDNQEFNEHSFPGKDKEENTKSGREQSSTINLLGNDETIEDGAILRSDSSNLLKVDSLISTLNAPTNDSNKSDASSKEKVADIRLWENITSTTLDNEMFELQALSLGTTQEVLSRKKRSGKLEKDAKFSSDRRKESRDNAGGHKSKVESFEARFYETFDFQKHFMQEECIVPDFWKNDTEICRDATVRFPHRYTTLPFYIATKETARKKSKQRMIVIDEAKPGAFKVQQPGDYLVQLNITVADETEKHFLALYLNGQAMFACQHGGFRCPHMNHHTWTKYRICNIIGLLELKKGDVMDIKTMEPNMKVHIKDERKTSFKVILLNKTK